LLCRHGQALAACYSGAEGETMRLAVYGAVLTIALGSVLLGLDWLSAPMSPMVDTDAGLRSVASPAVVTTPVPMAPLAPMTPKATIGAPIVQPSLVGPGGPKAPASSGVAAQVAPQQPIAAPEPEVACNAVACTAAYRSFRASDCTYLPAAGPRKLCTK
jgi:hypothetical protein